MIYEALMLVLEIGQIALPLPSYILHFAGIIVGCIVLAGYCIWKDVYWGLNNNRKRYGIILVIAGLLHSLPLFGALTPSESLDFPYVNLLTCGMLVVTGVELLLKHLLDKRAEKEDEA